jgi:hypothetical protein
MFEAMSGGDQSRRHDADHQIARKQRVGTVQKKIHRVRIGCLDARDHGQRAAVRRGIGRIENEIVAGLDVGGSEPCAVVETATVAAQCEAVMRGAERTPAGDAGDGSGLIVEFDQAAVQQAVDARRCRVTGVTRVECQRCALHAEAQCAGRLVMAGDELAGQDQQQHEYRGFHQIRHARMV